MPSTTPRGTTVTAQDLREVELFRDLTSDQRAWLVEAGTVQALDDGEVLFHDAEPARWFSVLVSGGLVITKTVDGREEVLTRHSVHGESTTADAGKPSAAHGFTGEMPLLVEGDYIATATATGPTTVIKYHRDAFLEMLVRCPQVAKVLVPVLAWRIHSSEVQAAHRTRLDALGTLAAGLAHELNNPAAAVARATTDLGTALPELEACSQAWGATATAVERERVAKARDEVLARGTARTGLDALGVAEAEDDLADWMDDHGLPEAEALTETLAGRGFGSDWLDRVTDGMAAGTRRAAVAYLDASLAASTLAGDAREAGARVSAIIATVKDYTNLDRAPEQEVDLVQGLESTLGIMRGRLAGIEVERRYASGLPLVCGYPTELNQVWTNLIDNAVDAMADSAPATGRDPVLRITVSMEGTCVVVQVADNGGGVPEDVLPRLFDPFFTTKDVGRGTGLGLHLSHRIVTQRHGGTISVASCPEGAAFSVRLPSRHPSD